MKLNKSIILVALTIIMTSCSSSKISQIKAEIKPSHQIKYIAINKVVGELDTAIGDDLNSRGYIVTYLGEEPKPVNANETKNMSIKKPINLSELLEKSIDAVLIVKSDHSGFDTNVRAAEVRLYGTRSNALIAGVSWKNAQAGFQGSFADAIVRQGIFSTAKDINDELIKQL